VDNFEKTLLVQKDLVF